MKYSFILPVWNGEAYVGTCLDSLLRQTYQNFEIIVIDDGSTDRSLEIIKNYEMMNPSMIRVIHQENKGLSVSRNRAVELVTGDYFLFIDHDDTVHSHLLETLEKEKEEEIDLFKIGYNLVYPDGESKEVETHYQGKVMTGEEALSTLVKDKNVFEMAVLYSYRTKFFTENEFAFIPGKFHEDFGLIPYVILKSRKVKLLDCSYYNYLQTDYSITRNDDYTKTVKKAWDVLYYYKTVKEKVEKTNVMEKTKNIFYSFLSNAVLDHIAVLKGSDKKEYKREIKKNKIIDDLVADTMVRKIKKTVKKISI